MVDSACRQFDLMRKDRRRAITVYRCIGGIPFSTSFGFLEELVMLERVVYALPGILLFPLLSKGGKLKKKEVL